MDEEKIITIVKRGLDSIVMTFGGPAGFISLVAISAVACYSIFQNDIGTVREALTPIYTNMGKDRRYN